VQREVELLEGVHVLDRLADQEPDAEPMIGQAMGCGTA
jgi:hypothetical protein